MLFLVLPPPEYAATDDYSLTYTIIEPDANDRSILHDLQHWGWLVRQHDFDDEEFIYALKGIEKDTRERRRHTHAVAGEVLGHHGKPTLEELWEMEARRMLDGTAYDEESNEALNNEHPLPVDGREESVVIDAEQEKNPRLQTSVETWLKHIDRTRQTNGFLDYNDSQHEQPRLLTRGLDHSPTDTAYNPAYAVYADLSREHGRPPPELDNEHAKAKSVSRYIEKSKSALQRLRRSKPAKIDLTGMGIVAGAPFAWTMYSQLHAYSRPYSQLRSPSIPVSRRKSQSEATSRKGKDKTTEPSIRSSNIATTSEPAILNSGPLAQPHTHISHSLAQPSHPFALPPLHDKPLPKVPPHHHPLPSSAHSNLDLHDNPSSDLNAELGYPLIFPGTTSSTRTYIRQTRPGIQSPHSPPVASHLTQSVPVVSPPLHQPGLGPDPWGWDEWDRRIQRDRGMERGRERYSLGDETGDRNAGIMSREDFCASLKFCVARKRKSSRAWERVRMKAREEMRVREADGRVGKEEEGGRSRRVDGNRNGQGNER